MALHQIGATRSKMQTNEKVSTCKIQIDLDSRHRKALAAYFSFGFDWTWGGDILF